MTMEELVRTLYERFNARDVDAVLSLLDPDVQWENGMHGGFLRGHDALRAYWRAQWSEIDPQVLPLAVEHAGLCASVSVRQIVRDLTGAIRSDTIVTHVFHFRNGKIVKFDIEK